MKNQFKDKEAIFIWSTYGNEDYGKRAFWVIKNNQWGYPNFFWREDLESKIFEYISNGWRVEVVDSDTWSVKQHQQYLENTNL